MGGSCDNRFEIGHELIGPAHLRPHRIAGGVVVKESVKDAIQGGENLIQVVPSIPFSESRDQRSPVGACKRGWPSVTVYAGHRDVELLKESDWRWNKSADTLVRELTKSMV